MAVIINPEEIRPNTVDADELGRVHGVTSPIQTQLDSKFDDIAGVQGDMLVRGSLAWEKKTQAEMIAIMHNMRKYSHYTCDFFSVGDKSMLYKYTTGGGGASLVTGGNYSSENVGVVSLYSSPATDYIGVYTSAVHFKLGGGLFYAEFSLMSSAYVDTDGGIVIRVGLMDVFTGAAIVDGLYFGTFHQPVGHPSNWSLYSAVGGVISAGVDTGISGGSGVGQTLSIAVNADASEAHFYIDGVECTGSPLYTIPTNETGLAVVVNKVVNASGTNTHYVAIDRIDMKYFFTNERK